VFGIIILSAVTVMQVYVFWRASTVPFVKNNIAMKSISIFIILTYILLPVVCFAHPTQLHVEVSSDVYDIFTSECPDKQDTDNCESACCCAEHIPFMYRAINTFPAIMLRGSSPFFLLTQISIPIFVPPQNMS